MDLLGSFRALGDLCEQYPNDEELRAQRASFAREILETRAGSFPHALEAAALWFEKAPALCHEAFWFQMAQRPPDDAHFLKDAFA